jgi:DNA-binding transcriptional ArsR family regulator
MVEKSITIDLDDPRSDAVAEAITNKTCKKILSMLADEEMSASDLAKELGLPLNTVGYNLEKLVRAGLIERSSSFFWSSKGKKIERYRVSNKRIVISPKIMVRGVLPTIIIAGILALILYILVGMTSMQVGFSKSAPMLRSDINEEKAAITAAPSPAEPAAQGGSAATSATPAENASSKDLMQKEFKEGQFVNEYAPAASSAERGLAWFWFFLGAIAAMVIFVLWNLRKK